MRKTKIICTIGPATESLEMLENLANAGMNVARLNMSHGNHESHKKVIDSIKILNSRLNHPIAVLLDTQGPEIRTGDMANDLHLQCRRHQFRLWPAGQRTSSLPLFTLTMMTSLMTSTLAISLSLLTTG